MRYNKLDPHLQSNPIFYSTQIISKMYGSCWLDTRDYSFPVEGTRKLNFLYRKSCQNIYDIRLNLFDFQDIRDSQRYYLSLLIWYKIYEEHLTVSKFTTESLTSSFYLNVLKELWIKRVHSITSISPTVNQLQ